MMRVIQLDFKGTKLDPKKREKPNHFFVANQQLATTDGILLVKYYSNKSRYMWIIENLDDASLYLYQMYHFHALITRTS